ncbi:conjugal transfer protein TraG N-terminal domain-containing protein [Escherichia coli]
MKKQYLLALSLLAVSPAAFAMDAEYVVMGGFTTIVNAFTRIKFMFNDNQYQMLVTAFVVLGLISGLLITSAKQTMAYLDTGKGQMGVGWLGMTLMATMLYFGLVQKKGTIHIYDQTRNQYQAVSGVPDLMILLAGVTNQVYQGVVDMANRNTATTTRFSGEGTPIKMLLGMLNRNGAQFDPYLTSNIKSMWNQCAPVAQARGFDPRTLKSGSAVLDIVSALAPLRNQAAYTVWSSPSNPAGVSVTCDQAYVSLKTDLGNPAAYNAKLQDICVKNGYKSGDAVQLTGCKSRMEEGLQTIFGASGLSLTTAMSNVVVSQAITDAMLQNNPDVAATMIANRSMINGGMADAVTNPEWLSSIMAGVIAIILAVTPMLLLLCFTPIFGKALTLMCGLWIFITVWQVADVLLLQAGMDEILTAMNDLRAMGLGIDAMQLGPTAAMKSMAVMASARESAVTVAVIVSSLFGISAYGISGFGQKAMSRLDRVSDETSEKAFTHEGRGGQIEAMQRGEAALKTASQFGGNIDLMSNASAFRNSSDIHSSSSQIQALGGTSAAAERTGAVDAGRSVGNTLGYENGNPGSGYANATQTSMVSTQASVGESQGQQESAIANGNTVAGQARVNSAVNHTTQTADAESTLKHAGGNLKSLHEQQSMVHGVQRQVDIGTAEGEQRAADQLGTSVQALTADKTAVNTASDYGSGQGLLQASGGNLAGVSSRQSYVSQTTSDEGVGRANALHKAYDDKGGIIQGVTVTQGEHLTQEYFDMQEQKANVQEVRDNTGQTESQARNTIAAGNTARNMGDLQGSNYQPRAMQDTAAFNTEKEINTVAGEKREYDNRNVSLAETSQRAGVINVSNSQAEQQKFNTISDTLGSDQIASEAMANANVQVALTNSDGEKMVKHNLLSETQAEAIPEGGVGVANISMRQNADGQNTSSATMHTGNSTKKDNSYTDDTGQTFGSETSAIKALTMPDKVSDFVRESERTQAGSSPMAVAMESSRALNSLYRETAEQMDQNSTKGSVGLSTPALGQLFGLKAEASASIEKANMHNSHTDVMTAMFENKVSGYRDEALKDANAQGLTGAQREKFVSDSVGTKSAILFNEVKTGLTQKFNESGMTPKVDDLHREEKPVVAAEGAENQSSTFSRNGINNPQAYLEQQRKNAEQAEQRSTQPINQPASSMPGTSSPTSERPNPVTSHAPQAVVTAGPERTVPVASGNAPAQQPVTPEAPQTIVPASSERTAPDASRNTDEQPKPVTPELPSTGIVTAEPQLTAPAVPVSAAEQPHSVTPNEPFNGSVGSNQQPAMQNQYRPAKTSNQEVVTTQDDDAGDDVSSSSHPPVNESGRDKGIPVEAPANKGNRSIPK